MYVKRVVGVCQSQMYQIVSMRSVETRPRARARRGQGGCPRGGRARWLLLAGGAGAGGAGGCSSDGRLEPVVLLPLCHLICSVTSDPG